MPNRVPANSPDANAAPVTSVDAAFGCNPYAASGAIAQKEGVVPITAGAAAALTLAAPNPGLPSAGGDDGKILSVISTTAFAHTVTTPANGINGSKHIATFAAAVDSFIQLVAYNGVWYATPQNGITLS